MGKLIFLGYGNSARVVFLVTFLLHFPPSAKCVFGFVLKGKSTDTVLDFAIVDKRCTSLMPVEKRSNV